MKVGLALRKTRDMNIAFLAKMGWRLINEKDNLWTEVLKHKYCKGLNGINEISASTNASNLWHGINEAKSLLEGGVRCHVQNGRDTKFWLDKWIEEVPLYSMVEGNIPDHLIQYSVADY